MKNFTTEDSGNHTGIPYRALSYRNIISTRDIISCKYHFTCQVLKEHSYLQL